MINIYDNFVDKEYFKKIEDIFFRDKTFPWFVNGVVANKAYKQFTHMFYVEHKPNSYYHEFLIPFYKQLKAKALIKVKANYLWKTEKIAEHGFHTDTAQHIKDHEADWKTALYYINTNNGYTKFENGKKVKSKANRLVIFPASVRHTGSTCTDKDERIVLNVNYYD
jgi:hypothetical protein|tara:strand:+ start:2092 stop:2589 length:498 start_codon:yes stop_codon:yes gene_type:complete